MYYDYVDFEGSDKTVIVELREGRCGFDYF